MLSEWRFFYISHIAFLVVSATWLLPSTDPSGELADALILADPQHLLTLSPFDPWLPGSSTVAGRGEGGGGGREKKPWFH